MRPTPPSVTVTADKLLSEIDTEDPQSVASAVNVFISANINSETQTVDPVLAAEAKESAANFGGTVIIDEKVLEAQRKQKEEVKKVKMFFLSLTSIWLTRCAHSIGSFL